MSDRLPEDTKPCPFCGVVPELGLLDGEPYNFVWCNNEECGALGVSIQQATWNKREPIGSHDVSHLYVDNELA